MRVDTTYDVPDPAVLAVPVARMHAGSVPINTPAFVIGWGAQNDTNHAQAVTRLKGLNTTVSSCSGHIFYEPAWFCWQVVRWRPALVHLLGSARSPGWTMLRGFWRWVHAPAYMYIPMTLLSSNGGAWFEAARYGCSTHVVPARLDVGNIVCRKLQLFKLHSRKT